MILIRPGKTVIENDGEERKILQIDGGERSLVVIGDFDHRDLAKVYRAIKVLDSTLANNFKDEIRHGGEIRWENHLFSLSELSMVCSDSIDLMNVVKQRKIKLGQSQSYNREPHFV